MQLALSFFVFFVFAIVLVCLSINWFWFSRFADDLNKQMLKTVESENEAVD